MLLVSANVASANVLISWYGPKFHGNCTAHQIVTRNKKGQITGSHCERYDQYAKTAAHKTLPMGTMVEISKGNRKVVVRINDRGPYISGRTFDVSYAAAQQLGFSGVASVTYKIISKENIKTPTEVQKKKADIIVHPDDLKFFLPLDYSPLFQLNLSTLCLNLDSESKTDEND